MWYHSFTAADGHEPGVAWWDSCVYTVAIVDQPGTITAAPSGCFRLKVIELVAHVPLIIWWGGSLTGNGRHTALESLQATSAIVQETRGVMDDSNSMTVMINCHHDNSHNCHAFVQPYTLIMSRVTC